METVKVNGEEYQVDLIADDKDYIVLKRVVVAKWRKAVNEVKLTPWDMSNPISEVLKSSGRIAGYYTGSDKAHELKLIVALAEKQADTKARVRLEDKCAFSTWEMLSNFCAWSNAEEFTLEPPEMNWVYLANYAATWLNYLLENK